MQKLTLILGASPNPDRASYDAVRTLKMNGIPVIAVGRREFDLGDIRIQKNIPEDIGDVHTISLYLSAANQAEYVDKILQIHPERIIFNPGTRNTDLAIKARDKGIEVLFYTPPIYI